MELSLLQNDNSPKMSGENCARKNLEWDFGDEEGQTTQTEANSKEVKDVNEHSSQNDDTSSHNEGENIKVPLLSPKDRLQTVGPRKSVQASPFRKSEEVPEVIIKQGKYEPAPKRAGRLSHDVGNRNRQNKKDRHSIPLLTISAETSEGLHTENIELDSIHSNDTSLSCQTVKAGIRVRDNDGIYAKKDDVTSDFIKNRRYRPWDTVGSHGKGHRDKAFKGLNPDLLRHWKWKFYYTVVPDSKKELTKAELLKSYRLHIFVIAIFIITALSVSLSWYFKNEAQEKLYSSQAIFFNPRTRQLTLSDSSKTTTIRGVLGRDIPTWMLPLHCPIVMGDDPHNKECLWKKVAILRVSHFQELQVQCYNVSWESLGAKYLPHDCIYIDQAKWYGPSNQSDSSFPIEGQFEYQPVVYTLNNNGLFNNVVDFYWLTSTGAAIYVDANNPIQVAWNISGNNQICFKSNFSGSLYHKSNVLNNPVMNYTLCQGTDPKETHKFMQTMFAPKTSVEFPHTSMLQGPHWSLKSIQQTDFVNQSHVVQLALTALDHGFSTNVITLDGTWQKSHGDLVFDKDRFYNVTEMMQVLNVTGCLLTLCVSPYFQYMSQNFHTGVTANMFVKDAGGDVTGLTNFQGGIAAILDFFSENSRKWYSQKLQDLMKTHQIESYRLTYGQHSWLPYKPHFDETDGTPNMYRKLFTEQIGVLPNVSLVVEHTADSRHVTSLISVPTRLSKDRKCLTGAIETALTLGLMGYPFVMADGVKVEPNLLQDELQTDGKPSRELYIRWLQLAALFPAYQYTIAPWEYDPDVVFIATNLSVMHNNVVLKEMANKDLQKEVSNGLPILRPVWWLGTHNHTVHDMGINDEFLIGNNLLVAPVLCEGVKERDIFIPYGVWENINQKTIVIGPEVISKHSVTLDKIIMFQRRPVAGSQSQYEL